MKLVLATEISTLILCWRASLLASPTVLPPSIVPWRWIAPVRARIASSSVVFPLWNGPTSAMHRGPVARVPFCAMSASLSSDRPPSFQAGGGIGKRRNDRAGTPARRADDQGRLMRESRACRRRRIGFSTIARAAFAPRREAALRSTTRRTQTEIGDADGEIEPDLA